jgi:hypothetical protein
MGRGSSVFSRFIAIRYLGGILELPSFWQQSGTLYRAFVQRLLCQAVILLKDLGVDSPATDGYTDDLSVDIEGVDIFCDALLSGIQTWLPSISSSTITSELWYPSLHQVLQLLRQYEDSVLLCVSALSSYRPETEDCLPRSWGIATAAQLRRFVPTDHEDRLVDTVVHT